MNLLGIIYAHENHFAEAIDAFERALKLQPNSARTHINLGNVYVAQNKFQLAENEFRTALKFEPANREASYNLGLVLLWARQTRESRPCWRP